MSACRYCEGYGTVDGDGNPVAALPCPQCLALTPEDRATGEEIAATMEDLGTFYAEHPEGHGFDMARASGWIRAHLPTVDPAGTP